MLNKSLKSVQSLIDGAKLHSASIMKRRKQMHHEEGAIMPMPWEPEPAGQVQHQLIDGSEINAHHNDNPDVKSKSGTRNSTGKGDHVWSKGKKSEPGVDLSASEQTDENNPRGKSFLPWAEGALAWDINEQSDWVKQSRNLSMPLAGGVSGTTNRMMNSAKMMKPGVPMSHVRLAALGYLLPIKAHSFHEVMTAARKFGLPYTDAQYSPLSPLNGTDFAQLPPIP